MRRAFTIRQDEAICRQGPARVGVPLALALGLAALAAWRAHWGVLTLLGITAFSAVMEAITWLDARRRLKRPEAQQRPARRARRGAVEAREDADVGRIDWRPEQESWCLDRPLSDDVIVVCLEGTRDGGPTAEAKALWRSIEPDLAALWGEVVAFVSAWSAERGGAPLDAAGLQVQSLSVSPGRPFEGGELTFDFSVADDPDGSYAVPVHDGKPLLVHRDS